MAQTPNKGDCWLANNWIQIVVNNLASKSGHNWIIGPNLAEKVKFDNVTSPLDNYQAIHF